MMIVMVMVIIMVMVCSFFPRCSAIFVFFKTTGTAVWQLTIGLSAASQKTARRGKQDVPSCLLLWSLALKSFARR